jgi:hypothetical protein
VPWKLNTLNITKCLETKKTQYHKMFGNKENTIYEYHKMFGNKENTIHEVSQTVWKQRKHHS